MSVQRALLIGINDYANPRADLQGCVPDVSNVDKFLRFSVSKKYETYIITDQKATHDASIAAYRKLRDISQPGDTLGLMFSGHGTQLPDQDGDEQDGLDEALCMADVFTNPTGFAAGCVSDDELRHEIALVPRGVRLWFWLDSCHSGTGTRELFALNSYRAAKFIAAPDCIMQNYYNRKRGLASIFSKIVKWRHKTSKSVIEADIVELLLAGCRADQTSSDAFIDGEYCGAFTHFILKAITENPALSIGTIVNKCAASLAKAGFSQIPQVEGTAANLAQVYF